MSRTRRFLRETGGATAVEMSILAPLFLIGVLMIFDLGLYFWRWNQVVEAARVGARVAAVSDPVASDLTAMTGLETGVQAGQPVGAYERVCSGSSCTNGSYSATAMARIYYGPGAQQTCAPGTKTLQAGMCDVFPTLQQSNVAVSYRSSGVDTAGMAGALKPLVSVRISGAASRVFIIDRLIPGALRVLPAAEVTVLAEDLRTAA